MFFVLKLLEYLKKYKFFKYTSLKVQNKRVLYLFKMLNFIN